VHLQRRPGWQLPESAATPEAVFRDRRRLLRSLAAGPILAAASPWMLAGCGEAGDTEAEGPSSDDPSSRSTSKDLPDLPAADDPSAHLYPVARNERYATERPVTSEGLTGKYNNFMEFGSSKHIQTAAQQLPIRPWTITIGGLVEAPLTVDIDDLLTRMPLEERVCRHRCVEGWSMVIPWSGFPLAALVDMASPLGSAKYVEMKTFLASEVAPGQRQFWYPWPYTEGLTMAEATNELAFMVTGAYGKPLAKQFGSPLRLATPWKYGFKHIKSVQQITFTDQRPVTFWEEVGGGEYGFWANVNPDVPHPRWSQATETDLATREDIPTQLFNGYAEFVAHIYDELERGDLFR
jgi:methionine sulfoxide reductase catalytic subunit